MATRVSLHMQTEFNRVYPHKTLHLWHNVLWSIYTAVLAAASWRQRKEIQGVECSTIIMVDCKEDVETRDKRLH